MDKTAGSKERASKKQQELYDFVEAFILEHGYGPSYREIMSALDYKSVSTVAVHVDGLISKGYLKKLEGSARSLVIAEPKEDDELQACHDWLVGEVSLRVKGVNERSPRKEVLEAGILVDALEILGLEEASARLGGVLRGGDFSLDLDEERKNG